MGVTGAVSSHGRLWNAQSNSSTLVLWHVRKIQGREGSYLYCSNHEAQEAMGAVLDPLSVDDKLSGHISFNDLENAPHWEICSIVASEGSSMGRECVLHASARSSNVDGEIQGQSLTVEVGCLPSVSSPADLAKCVTRPARVSLYGFAPEDAGVSVPVVCSRG